MKVACDSNPFKLIVSFNPHEANDDPEKQTFVDERVCVIVPIFASFKNRVWIWQERIISILLKNDDQVDHVSQENKGVYHVLKLEVFHNSLGATCVHALVKHLEDVHPLEIENKHIPHAWFLKFDQFFVNFGHDSIEKYWVDEWGDFAFRCIGKVDRCIYCFKVCEQVLPKLEMMNGLPLYETYKCKVGDRRNQVAALACKAPHLELEPMTTNCI